MATECECADPKCPEAVRTHRTTTACGQTTDLTTVQRWDAAGVSVTFCPGCLSDALASGLYDDIEADDEDEEEIHD